MAREDEIRSAQRSTWSGLAAGWEKWDSIIVDQLAPVGDAMIGHLAIVADDHVLDVASGTGEPGLTIARLVPDGRIVLTDLVPAMPSRQPAPTGAGRSCAVRSGSGRSAIATFSRCGSALRLTAPGASASGKVRQWGSVRSSITPAPTAVAMQQKPTARPLTGTRVRVRQWRSGSSTSWWETIVGPSATRTAATPSSGVSGPKISAPKTSAGQCQRYQP